MNDSYIQIAIVSVLAVIGWTARSVIADLKAGLKDLSDAIKSLARDLKEARKELDNRMDSQGSTLHLAISGLDRRLSVIEGRCASEHGQEPQRRSEDAVIHRAKP